MQRLSRQVAERPDLRQRLNEYIEKQLQRSERLRLLLWLAWPGFISAGILVSAFCFSLLFLPSSQHLPVSLWIVIMALAALRLLSLGLSELHHRLGQLLPAQLAQRHFRWALHLTPGNAEIYCNWGQLLRQSGDPDQALSLFERARILQPDDDMAYVQMAYLALSRDDWREASRLFDLAYRLRRGVAWNDLPDRLSELSPAPPRPRPIHTSLTKLQHDAQQLEFLLQGSYLPERFGRLLQAYQELLRQHSEQGPALSLSSSQMAPIQLIYGRNVYISPVPAFPREVLNPQHHPKQIEADYLNSDPACVIVDDLLLPDACEALLHFCQKSTIWHDDSRPGGYLGAYLDDGFSCDLLYQIALELRDALPQVFKGLPLKHMWAYKYDSQREGIGIHADGAAINVNFWITPDQANLDPEHGGLLIYPVRAPADWSFAEYNQDTAKAEAMVKGLDPIRVPYRQNRAVIFDSRLFHATDNFRFRDDYLMRRINITLLYGR
ncbi:MAG: hypothetical protein CVV27_01300 [Candidatus Melainabacteria bacterium HGW-Melainabacteria-1]|nr:MAG: hypothetical protein CVV27_01300 [Candidatus Melainabacteria bacterium HGW-Melainabacteria-1]